MKYNLLKLHNELTAAGLKIVGVDGNGGISWVSAPTAAQKKQAQTIINAHDPTEAPKVDQVAELKKEIQELKTVLIANKIIEGEVKI